MLHLTVDSLQGLKGFNPYSYGANALERWTAGLTVRQLDRRIVRIVLIESYEMAIEQFLKHIVGHSTGLSREHIHSHNVWKLACDADFHGREKYGHMLRQFSKYYNEERYESDDPEQRQALFDYLLDEDTLNLADEFLYSLYTAAKDVDRSASKSATTSVNDSVVIVGDDNDSADNSDIGSVSTQKGSGSGKGSRHLNLFPD